MKTIQIDNKDYIKAKVIMLASDNEPSEGTLLLRHLWKDNPKLECRSLWQYKETIVIDNVKQYTTLNGSFRDHYVNFKPQHLYIISNEEINVNDWVVDSVNVVRQVTNINSEGRLSLSGIDFLTIVRSSCKKIIATTNNDLSIRKDDFFNRILEALPNPSNEFIQQYIKNPIEDVLVEVELDWDKTADLAKEEQETTMGYLTSEYAYKMKLCSNHTISIIPDEQSISFYKIYEDFMKLDNQRTAYEFLKHLEENFSAAIIKNKTS